MQAPLPSIGSSIADRIVIANRDGLRCPPLAESRHSVGLTVAIASVSGEERPYGETTTDRDADPDADLSDRAGGRRHDGGP